MTQGEIGAVILAAGKGTRMRSVKHKVLHEVAGLPLVKHVLKTLDQLDARKRVVVIGAQKEQLLESLDGVEFAVQEPQLGTGHAVMVAREQFEGFKGDVLILYGDVPLTSAATLNALIQARRSASKSGKVPALAVLGFSPIDAAAYGRLVLNSDGQLESIKEFKDASPSEREIKLCNSGIMAVDGSLLFGLLEKINNKNAASEYYLTDIVKVARDSGYSVAVVETDEAEVAGVNSMADLAFVEGMFQKRARRQALTDGVTMIDPQTVYFSHDTILGSGVVIEPNVVFGPAVAVGDDVRILSFSHLEGCRVGNKSVLGPYARLRPGAELHENVKIGNFVELKKSVIGKGAKVNHLSYVGDADVGDGANIGAGTITCNYDGYSKSKTIIGKGAFVGSNTSLVAPVTIGDGAIVGAGSVVTKDVTKDALVVERSTQKEVANWAANFRAHQTKNKK